MNTLSEKVKAFKDLPLVKSQLADVKQRLASLNAIQNEVPVDKFESLSVNYQKDIDQLQSRVDELSNGLNSLKEEIALDTKVLESKNTLLDNEINDAKFMFEKGALNKQDFDAQIKTISKKIKGNNRLTNDNSSAIKNLEFYSSDIQNPANNKSGSGSNRPFHKQPVLWVVVIALIGIAVTLFVIMGDKVKGVKNDANEFVSDEAEEEPQDNSETKSDNVSNEFISNTKQILKTNAFVAANGMTSILIFNFDDNNFTFRAVAIGGLELSRMTGPYYISPASDGSIANIRLDISGPVQKSPMNQDSEGIDTEVFMIENRELRLKPYSEELINYLGPTGSLTMGDVKPEYFLVGKNAFHSSKLKTQAEQDSINAEKKRAEEYEKELNEKLKGL